MNAPLLDCRSFPLTMTATNLLVAVPVLHVSSSKAAEEFYVGCLGFSKEWDYRPDASADDPGYVGLRRDGIWLHVSSFCGDGVAGGIAAFYVRDVDALHAEFAVRGVAMELEPYDQSWGTREMYIRDADGNSLRFIQRMQ